MGSLVLHVDIDAFFASVEEARNPALRGRPVAVGSGVVASASYAARKFGIRAGTSLRKARSLCPDLVIIAGHAPIYRCFSDRIFALCAEYAPTVETYLDEAYCDWSGTERIYPDPIVMAEEIRRRVREDVGVTITAGLGRNRMLAKMASKSAKPDGLRRILPADEETFLLDLPVSRLPGVGPRTERLLQRLNVRTIGEMRMLSRDSLRAMLGMPGLALYERCRGEDTLPVSRREIPRSIQRETSFHQDTIDRTTIEGTLHYLTERAANTMRRLGLQARQAGVKVRYGDGIEESMTRKLPSPTEIDSEIFDFAMKVLKVIHTRRAALHLVGVVLTGFIADNGFRQLEIIGTAAASSRRERGLLESLDAIRERYGYASVVCGRSLDLLGKLAQDDHGFILRTSSLTK
jgi:DNA polymerase IV